MVDIPRFTQKANKAPAQDLLCSQRPQAPSRWGEGAEHLLERVLEAWAGKWTQKASALQGINLKKKRGRTTRGGQASVSEARHFIFRGSFYTLSCTLSKVKNAESAQQSFSINFYRYQVSSCIPFHKQGSYFLYIIFWPGGLLTFYDPFLIKVGQLKHLLSLEMFFLKFLSLRYP